MRTLRLIPAIAALLLAGCARREWTDAVPVAERAPRPQELIAYPRDGQNVAVNPPGFCWTPAEGARAYRLEVRRADGGTVLSTAPQASTVFAAGRGLDPGEYEWQVVYLGANDVPAGASRTRRFTVPANAQPLPMPEIAKLKAQVAGKRPRLFLAGTRLKEIKQAVDSGTVAWWKPFRETADAAVAEKSYAEPAGYPTAAFNVDDWRRIYTPAKQGSAHVARTALAWQITGEPKYLEAARRWMLDLASWNPRGVTAHKVRQPNGSEGNDEASMPILDRMALGWDWAGDRLTPEDRAKVLAAMTERGNQVLEVLQKQDFLTHPFSNHEGRVLAFLGNAGLSFLGDIPDADRWLDYVLRCYLTSYPGWGGDEGGWAQGMSYWSAYVYFLTSFAEALRGATDVDLFRRPFYHNTGYLALYFQPPYAPRGAFGDGNERGPGESQQLMIERFADAFNDPVLRWESQSIPVPAPSREGNPWREWAMEDVGAVLRARPEGAKAPARSPADLDGSRCFADIGWASMHSALGDAANDVWVAFKSSRFGSFSHSHADQNTFQVNAYGRALLIDSGYYPWYGSPHDGLWTRQTRAHNGVLVNGRGQPPHAWEASGDIDSYVREGNVTLVRGQAAGAYNVPQTAGIAKMWEKSLREPIPPMTPEVETFERTVAFVASKPRPVIVVSDYIRTSAPTTFEWLAHSLNQMQADGRTGAIRVRDGDARLAVRLVAARPLTFSQTDRFTVPPEYEHSSACAANPKDCASKFPNQWHLGARSESPTDEMRFLAVMVPYRASEPEPAITPLDSPGAAGFRAGGTEVSAWWGKGPGGKMAAGEGRLVLRVTEDGKGPVVVSK